MANVQAVMGQMVPIPREQIRTHVLITRCPACMATVRTGLHGAGVRAWASYQLIQIECECGHTYAATQPMVKTR